MANVTHKTIDDALIEGKREEGYSDLGKIINEYCTYIHDNNVGTEKDAMLVETRRILQVGIIGKVENLIRDIIVYHAIKKLILTGQKMSKLGVREETRLQVQAMMAALEASLIKPIVYTCTGMESYKVDPNNSSWESPKAKIKQKSGDKGLSSLDDLGKEYRDKGTSYSYYDEQSDTGTNNQHVTRRQVTGNELYTPSLSVDEVKPRYQFQQFEDMIMDRDEHRLVDMIEVRDHDPKATLLETKRNITKGNAGSAITGPINELLTTASDEFVRPVNNCKVIYCKFVFNSNEDEDPQAVKGSFSSFSNMLWKSDTKGLSKLIEINQGISSIKGRGTDFEWRLSQRYVSLVTHHANVILKYVLQTALSVDNILTDMADLQDVLSKKQYDYLSRSLAPFMNIKGDLHVAIMNASHNDLLKNNGFDDVSTGWTYYVPILNLAVSAKEAGLGSINELCILSSRYHDGIIQSIKSLMECTPFNGAHGVSGYIYTTDTRYQIFESPMQKGSYLIMHDTYKLGGV